MDSLYLYFPVLFLVLYIISHHFLHKLQNLPPSPFPALPFIGHLYLLGKPFHRALFKVSNRYGPVVFLQFGCRPVLLVSSPSAAEECFTKNDIIFANRPDFLSGKYFGYNFTSLAWSSYGEHWRNLRRISSLEVLSSYRIQTLSSIRSDEISYLIRRLFRVSSESSDKIVEMKSSLFDFTFNVISRMIAGKRYYGENVENSKEAKLFQDLSKDIITTIPKANILDFLPFMRWFGFHSVEEKLMEIQEKRDTFMQTEIEEHRQKTSGSFPSAEVLLQAGSDTSAATLEWAFSHLLDNPEILKKAQAEIDKHVGQERLIDESDLAELPYIRCIINETLRMHPAAPLLVPHFSSAECKVAGYRVPSGTVLLVNVWGIHNDPKVWEDPENFNPDRFIGFEGVKEGCKFIPFGSGRRGCPGENLAIHIIGFALGSLLQCFEWEKPNMGIIDMSEGTGFTLSPKVLLQAGSDTSAATLEWAFSHLLDNPEILKKAQAEIDKHVGKDRLIDESDLAELPYIRCIINETLRMNPAAPLLAPHFSSAECKVAGYRVPRGTILLVNVWGIQNDPKIWEDPEKFNPDRFIGFEGFKEGCKFLPFGSGRRGCPGENLAIHIIGFALGSLLQCFEWEKPNMGITDMSEGTGFALSPKVQPLLAKCSPRPSMVKLLSEL